MRVIPYRFENCFPENGRDTGNKITCMLPKVPPLARQFSHCSAFGKEGGMNILFFILSSIQVPRNKRICATLGTRFYSCIACSR